MIENSSKTPLNFSPLQCTYFGKIHFNITRGLVRKNEIEKRLLRTSVQCISRINTPSESLKAREVFIFQHLSFYEQLKVHAQLS